ncbi:ribonuclease HI [Candidatus Rickettsia kotlanii]|nr:ribonuclease HI [Candidatus Rickettsia kotlanii]BDU61004.1 ribonuclease HI [Candidatus Rickettsia kotlanii]
MHIMDSKVVIYTDGACAGNPGPGGWGALLQFNDTSKEVFGYELDTTNNRMEITAALEALRVLKKSCNIEIYTDSKYLQQGITAWIHNWIKNNWCKSNNEPVKNADLWQKLYAELSKHTIIWKWVKGHANNSGNIAADKLAVQGRETAIEILKCRG